MRASSRGAVSSHPLVRTPLTAEASVLLPRPPAWFAGALVVPAALALANALAAGPAHAAARIRPAEALRTE
jgi:hypothetical protein